MGRYGDYYRSQKARPANGTAQPRGRYGEYLRDTERVARDEQDSRELLALAKSIAERQEKAASRTFPTERLAAEIAESAGKGIQAARQAARKPAGSSGISPLERLANEIAGTSGMGVQTAQQAARRTATPSVSLQWSGWPRRLPGSPEWAWRPRGRQPQGNRLLCLPRWSGLPQARKALGTA